MKKLLMMTAAAAVVCCVFAETPYADWTVDENTTLSADMTVETLTVNEGVTLDLNGHKLTCSALAGAGTITSTGDGEDVDLTSPEAAGGTPSAVTWSYAGNIASGSVTNLFDDDFTTYSDPHRLRTDTTLNNQHFTICYDFGEDTPQVVNKYKIYNGWGSNTRSPYIWDFEGSNDNSTWVMLHNVEESGYSDVWSDVKTSIEREFVNTTAYRYYRFVFKKTGTAAFELKQLEYFNTKPGELHVNVAGGETENSTVAISGNVKVVKEGEGTFTATKHPQSYTGGTTVLEGTLKAGAENAAIFGVKGGTLTVSANGTFDVNQQTRIGDYVDLVLDGGTVMIGETGETVFGMNNGKLSSVALTADSTFDFANRYGLYDPVDDSATLDLGGNTLTCRGASGTAYGAVVFENVTVASAGNINVADSTIQFWGRSKTDRTNDFRKAVITLGPDAQMCTYNLPVPVLLGDLLCNTAATDSGHDGSNYRQSTPKLFGTFKPNTDYFHGVELQDGATIDLSGRTTALPLRGLRYPDSNSSYTSLHTVTFAAPEDSAESITIYVKLGERQDLGKLISWSAIPENVNFVSAPGENRTFTLKDNGLFIPTGLVISFH